MTKPLDEILVLNFKVEKNLYPTPVITCNSEVREILLENIWFLEWMFPLRKDVIYFEVDDLMETSIEIRV